MHFLPRRMRERGIPDLVPPITEDEKRWWATERLKVYRGVLLGMGVPYFLALTVGAVIVSPEKLLHGLPMFAGIAAGASLFQGRMMELQLRPMRVRWKRMREHLLAESTDEPR
jgi:hypothetical protein